MSESIYLDPLFRHIHGFPPIHTFYIIDYTDHHVELFSSDLGRAMKLATDEPETVAGLRILNIPEEPLKSYPQPKPLKTYIDNSNAK